MKMFSLESYGQIVEIDIVRQTESSVFFADGRRASKTTDWQCIRPNRDECKAWLIAKREKELSNAKAGLEYAQERLEKAKSL